MKSLLVLGVKTQSLTILNKYLRKTKVGDQLLSSILKLSLEHRKEKVITLLFDKFGHELYLSLSKDNLDIVEELEKNNNHLSNLLKPFKESSSETLLESFEYTNELESKDGFVSDWVTESEPTPYKSDDSKKIYEILLDDKAISKVKLRQEDQDWGEVNLNFLPSDISTKKQFSAFVQINKSKLKTVFRSLEENNVLDIQVLLEDIFESKYKLETLIEIIGKVNHNILSFDDWLEEVDSYLDSSSNPNYENYIFNLYHLDIYKHSTPLDSSEESELILKIFKDPIKLFDSLCNEAKDSVVESILEFISSNGQSEYFSYELFESESSQQLPTKEHIKEILKGKIGRIKPISITRLINEIPSKTAQSKEIIKRFYKNVNKFQVANLRLVLSNTKKYKNFYYDDYFDLVQEGNISLISALNNYDVEKGFKFSTYATWWIMQAVTRFIADSLSTVRIPVHKVEKINKVKVFCRDHQIEFTPQLLNDHEAINQISLEKEIEQKELESFLKILIWQDFEFDFKTIPFHENVHDFEGHEEVNYLLEHIDLKEKEKDIILKRFGLDGNKENTLEEIGQVYGITRERVRQIEAKTIKKLRKKARILGINNEI